jgi:hypothetical protein
VFLKQGNDYIEKKRFWDARNAFLMAARINPEKGEIVLEKVNDLPLGILSEDFMHTLVFKEGGEGDGEERKRRQSA